MLRVATKNVGFAFLRYADADSSLRAIAGEVCLSPSSISPNSIH